MSWGIATLGTAVSEALAKPAPLEALFFPKVAIVVIAARSPPRSPRSTGADFPKTAIIDRAEFESAVRFSLEEPAPLEALSFPKVTIVVVAALFPKTWFISRAEFQGPQKLGALPKVALRHHRA